MQAEAEGFDWQSYQREHWRQRIEEAREDPSSFIEYVGDGSGQPIFQEDAHREWQDLITYHKKVVILAPVGSGKTGQVRGRLLYEIGRNPDTTFIGYISQSEDHPTKQAGALKEMIERNPKVRHVFPKLRRSRSKWTTKRFTVERETTPPEPTFQIYGLYGKILGARKNIIVLDDICGFINTLTKASREKMFAWLAEVFSRLKGEVMVIAIGHIWHEEDALQLLNKKLGWPLVRYAATYTDDAGVEQLAFPRLLPAAKIEELVHDLGPVFARMMVWNELPANTLSRFPGEWFEVALQQGENTTYWPYKIREALIVTGVDLGHKKTPGSDWTVMITVALEEVDGRQKRRVIDHRRGQWSGPQIIAEMQALRELFDTTFFVEDNGGQQYIADFAEDDAMMPVPVYTETTTGTGAKGKYDLRNGVEGALGGELKVGMWILPCSVDPATGEHRPPDGVLRMIMGATAFDPSPSSHTSDDLMAWWLAWKGCQHFRPRRMLPPERDPLRI